MNDSDAEINFLEMNNEFNNNENGGDLKEKNHEKNNQKNNNKNISCQNYLNKNVSLFITQYISELKDEIISFKEKTEKNILEILRNFFDNKIKLLNEIQDDNSIKQY